MSRSATSSVSLEQLVALNDEIAALVRTGVPLETGLREMGSEAGGATGEISLALAARMQAGASLPDALGAEEQRIPPMYRTVVEAGLRSGRLSAALEAVSNFARELIELRRQIGSAMVYPLIVFVLAYGLFLAFMVDLVERLRETYEMFRIPLHGALTGLVWLSDRVSSWWWIPPAVVAGVIAWWVSTGGAHVLSFTGSARPLGWIPGIGRIGRYLQLANFSELLALLVEHQVPLPDGLRLSADATGDVQIRSAAYEIAEAVEQSRDVTNVARGPAERPLVLEVLLWSCAWPYLLLVRVVRAFSPQRATIPPFLHWIVCETSRGANSVRLLRQAGAFYRRRALRRTNFFKMLFPMLTAVVIGGGITLMYALALFGPLAELWRDLVIE